jgi:hypothetical protein
MKSNLDLEFIRFYLCPTEKTAGIRMNTQAKPTALQKKLVLISAVVGTAAVNADAQGVRRASSVS